MKSSYLFSSAKAVLLALIVIVGPGYSVAGEHSWIMPGQCTPPELWTRGIVGTMEPKLGEHDKIVFDMKGGRLVMELDAVGPESLTVGWMWITPEKVVSGSSIFPTSSDSLVLTGAEDAALKSLKFTCSFDRQAKRLLLRLGLDSPRYALINQQGEQAGGGQPATRPESK